jgi:hypothetical protein
MTSMRIGRSLLGILVVTVGVFALPSAAAAQAVTTDTPFSASVLNTCTNEVVDITGVQTNTMLTKIDSAGGVHISFALVTKGTGVGEITGTSYPYNENDLFKLESGAAGTTTLRVKSRLKGPGSVDNWDMTFMVHLTINADGTATSVIDTFETTCRG